jgi:hypothetical protein
MKIEVDTKNDSKEEILHAIKLLKVAIGDSSFEDEILKESFSNDSNNDKKESSNMDFANLFSNETNNNQNTELFPNKEENNLLNNDDLNNYKAEQDNIDINQKNKTEINNINNNNDSSNPINFIDFEEMQDSIATDDILKNEENKETNRNIKKKENQDLDNIEVYESFYKEFKDDDNKNIVLDLDNKDNTEKKEEKQKKKLFNIDFY